MTWWVLALRLTGMGWYIAACVTGGIVGGIVLDNWLGTAILFTSMFLILGIVIAFYGVSRMVLPFLNVDDGTKKVQKENN